MFKDSLVCDSQDVKKKKMEGKNYEDKKKAYIGKILQDTKSHSHQKKGIHILRKS